MESEFIIDTPAYALWKPFGIRHHHGINIPLFSLHSAQSCGVGEFLDLLPMIDWCQTIHFDIIQLLPLNDTGRDQSPYNALSAYALNPIHLSLSALPKIDFYPELQEMVKELHKLNNSQHIAYNQVREGKEEFLRLYYDKESKNILAGEEYQAFAKNTPWLREYALFKALKEHYGWVSWEDWPSDIKNPSTQTVDSLLKQHQKDIEWHCAIQYLCYTQLRTVKEYASQKGVFLMGDIPILISRDSADVWFHRALFNLDYAAGAPPDFYNKEGQKWGFPLYRWDRLAEDDYRWWRERLTFATNFYHLYRIDHVIGFFRIWAFPYEARTGGRFIPEDKEAWLAQGKILLQMLLSSSSMLPIAEDLGEVPTEVRPHLKALGICGTKVMRWERFWEGDRSFIPPYDYSVISMTTVSTHDSETVSLWWKEHPDEAMEFAKYAGWTYHPVLSRDHLLEILWESHHTSSLLHVNLLQEYLALIPGLTWPHLEDERINLPGVISSVNWSYRFRPSVEEIISNASLAHTMSEFNP